MGETRLNIESRTDDRERSRTNRHRTTRRRFLAGAGAITLGLGLGNLGRQSRAANEEASSAEALANVSLPPDWGQTDKTVYISETGHTLRGSMLDYWRANGGAAIYGYPISEPFASSDGYYSQAFERGVFQYRYEFIDTEDPIMRLMPIGRLVAGVASDAPQSGGRRGGGGGDRRLDYWRPLDVKSDAVKRVVDGGGAFDEESGHTLSGAIADWYSSTEGDFYLGKPLSEPVIERGLQAQYFEGGLILAGADRTTLAPMGTDLIQRLGIATKRVPQGDVPTYTEALFATAANPDPQSDGSETGRKTVEVSLNQQQAWIRQGGTLVLTTLVSTGLAPNVTAPGRFHVRMKFPKQDMQGFTNDTGEVVAVGTDKAPENGAAGFSVPDVPNVMYFSTSAEALHGTYWHNNFGNPMSHGCVNLPLDVAAWMYGWAPLGVEVVIHE